MMVRMSANPYLVGPVVAFAAVGLIALLLKWAFARDPAGLMRLPRRGSSDDYGSLVAVATAASMDQAEAWQACLAEEGIRATTADTVDHGPCLLVLPADRDRARRLLRRG